MPIHSGGKIVSFDYKVRDAALDRSYMLIYMLSEWFMQIMHIIPKGIPPQTARINCRKLAIKSVVLGAKGEGHWESKDIQLLEPSRMWWWRQKSCFPQTWKDYVLFPLGQLEVSFSLKITRQIMNCFHSLWPQQTLSFGSIVHWKENAFKNSQNDYRINKQNDF